MIHSLIHSSWIVGLLSTVAKFTITKLIKEILH